MKHCLATGLFIMFAAALGETDADDTIALRYAQEAAAALRAEFDAIKAKGSVPSSQLQKLKSDLHTAELTLLRLKDDNAGIQRLLQAEVDRHAAQLKQQQSLAERGYAAETELSASELRLLNARCNLARHTGDKAGAALAIRQAIAIEESQLQLIVRLASRGYAGNSSIAKQKLRIAQLIATITITLPSGS